MMAFREIEIKKNSETYASDNDNSGGEEVPLGPPTKKIKKQYCSRRRRRELVPVGIVQESFKRAILNTKPSTNPENNHRKDDPTSLLGSILKVLSDKRRESIHQVEQSEQRANNSPDDELKMRAENQMDTKKIKVEEIVITNFDEDEPVDSNDSQFMSESISSGFSGQISSLIFDVEPDAQSCLMLRSESPTFPVKIKMENYLPCVLTDTAPPHEVDHLCTNLSSETAETVPQFAEHSASTSPYDTVLVSKGRKRYCRICTKAFSNGDFLARHLYIHIKDLTRQLTQMREGEGHQNHSNHAQLPNWTTNNHDLIHPMTDPLSIT